MVLVKVLQPLLVFHIAEEGTLLVPPDEDALRLLVLGVEAELAFDAQVVDAERFVLGVGNVEAFGNS